MADKMTVQAPGRDYLARLSSSPPKERWVDGSFQVRSRFQLRPDNEVDRAIISAFKTSRAALVGALANVSFTIICPWRLGYGGDGNDELVLLVTVRPDSCVGTEVYDGNRIPSDEREVLIERRVFEQALQREFVQGCGLTIFLSPVLCLRASAFLSISDMTMLLTMIQAVNYDDPPAPGDGAFTDICPDRKSHTEYITAASLTDTIPL
ncbi:hypothetical protein CONLIGDRAFT_645205 [Coniochaeta ligniaria NRRL 30616]|uniref:Uncharacterized protein n=1 Tax=Coniochaeta ligniaria NRRL 30616 TaxID=1408157 RepID=A0A1J7JMX3_9PEZI|nr:hypothetical protein CONLIGDRAFT_645205 [Coniochaeta ligniaria NRRL 30616]